MKEIRLIIESYEPPGKNDELCNILLISEDRVSKNLFSLIRSVMTSVENNDAFSEIKNLKRKLKKNWRDFYEKRNCNNRE